MKPLVGLLIAAVGVAALAFATDSVALLMVSIVALLVVIVGMFVLGLGNARRTGFALPFVVIVVGSLVLAAAGVTAIVIGERGDAPGLILLGIVLIVSVIVGAFAQGARTGKQTT